MNPWYAHGFMCYLIAAMCYLIARYHRALGARTPHQRRKLPKLEHVALNSACETGAKMHQNAQICKLNFKNFLGAMPQTPYRGGVTEPLPRSHFPQRSGASRLARLALGLRPLHRPPNQKSWIHPWAHLPSENPGYACGIDAVSLM